MHSSNVYRVLLIEDDPDTARVMSRVLENRPYYVRWVETGQDARIAIDEQQPDLIILDLTLPDTDGLLLTGTLRTITSAPVIICSARHQQVDRVLGLKLGADDFIAKPFDIEELEARVEAVLRRASRPNQSNGSHTGDIHVGDLTISEARGTVLHDGRPIQFTPSEFRLLLVLARHRGEVVSRELLTRSLWGYADETGGHVIDVHIGRMRRKLRNRQCSSPTIMTVRGRGFTLEIPAEPVSESDECLDTPDLSGGLGVDVEPKWNVQHAKQPEGVRFEQPSLLSSMKQPQKMSAR
jgi:DNA-binding response OmpR family regulator